MRLDHETGKRVHDKSSDIKVCCMCVYSSDWNVTQRDTLHTLETFTSFTIDPTPLIFTRRSVHVPGPHDCHHMDSRELAPSIYDFSCAYSIRCLCNLHINIQLSLWTHLHCKCETYLPFETKNLKFILICCSGESGCTGTPLMLG